MDKKKLIDYLTTFELMSERERIFFRNVGSKVNSTLRSLVDGSIELYRHTPVAIRTGILTSALTAAVILGYQASTNNNITGTNQNKPKVSDIERICVEYRVERAPVADPLYVSECVTPERLAEMHRDPYITLLK